MICKVCTNSENNEEYKIREMMFGFGDEFTYFECLKCGCLQIADILGNIEKYYPANYLSSHRHRPLDNSVGRFLEIRRGRYELFNTGLIGKLLNKVYPRGHLRPYLREAFQAIARAGVSYETRVLDVGCGSGELLYPLKHLGIRNLLGVDPYISDEVVNGDMKILKKTVRDLPNTDRFDLIIFNHSFEHIPDQLETLLKVSDILAANGVCLIRMPVKTEHIWNLYGVDWVQIDAPRHFFLHTLKSFNYLAEQAGLAIEDVVFDSTAFQFWGSEQYKRDIPLEAANSYGRNRKRTIFTAKQFRQFSEMARELNQANEGDQAAFYLSARVI